MTVGKDVSSSVSEGLKVLIVSRTITTDKPIHEEDRVHFVGSRFGSTHYICTDFYIKDIYVLLDNPLLAGE